MNLSVQKEKFKALEKGSQNREIGTNKAPMTDAEKLEEQRKAQLTNYLKKLSGELGDTQNLKRAQSLLRNRAGQGNGGFMDLLEDKYKSQHI